MRHALDWLDVHSKRRPLWLAACAFAAGLCAPLPACAVVAAALVAFRRRCLVVAAAALFAGALRAAVPDAPPPIPFDRVVTVRGTVARVFEGDPALPWSLREVVLDLDDPPARVLARGALAPRDAGPGDRVEATGVFAPLPPEGKPRAWLERMGAQAVLHASGALRPLTGDPGPLDRLRRLRRTWGELLSARIDDDLSARLARSILLGDRNAVPRDSEQAFRATGTTHVLVASGMNVVLLAGVVGWVLSRLGASRATVRGVIVLLALLYSVVAGAEAPIVRAAVSLSAWLLAETAGRPADSLNLIGLAALAILAIDPAQRADPGFQLSFVSVVSLVVLTPAILGPRRVLEEDGALARLREGTRRALATNLAAWTGTAPLVLLHFGMVAPVGLAVNLVVAPLVGLVLTSALAVLAWQALPCPTPFPLPLAVVASARALDWVVRLGARVPYGCLRVEPPTPTAVVVCYAAMAGGVLLTKRWGRVGLAMGALCGALALGAA